MQDDKHHLHAGVVAQFCILSRNLERDLVARRDHCRLHGRRVGDHQPGVRLLPVQPGPMLSGAAEQRSTTAAARHAELEFLGFTDRDNRGRAGERDWGNRFGTSSCCHRRRDTFFIDNCHSLLSRRDDLRRPGGPCWTTNQAQFDALVKRLEPLAVGLEEDGRSSGFYGRITKEEFLRGFFVFGWWRTSIVETNVTILIDVALDAPGASRAHLLPRCLVLPTVQVPALDERIT